MEKSQLSLEELLARQGIKKTRAINNNLKGGYEEDVTGREIAEISSYVDQVSSVTQTLKTNYMYEKCLIVEECRSYYGCDEYAHYHEEIFNWDCDQKFKDMVVEMWGKPDYDGYLSKKGENLRLKLVGKNAKL